MPLCVCVFACCCLAWISQQAQYLAEVCLCSRGRRKSIGDSEFCFSALPYLELHLICVFFFCGGGGGGGGGGGAAAAAAARVQGRYSRNAFNRCVEETR